MLENAMVIGDYETPALDDYGDAECVEPGCSNPVYLKGESGRHCVQHEIEYWQEELAEDVSPDYNRTAQLKIRELQQLAG